ncbi:MAG: pirin family protein [candidate division WOR-3 bacterium]
MTKHSQVRLKVSAIEAEEGAGARVRRVFPTPHLRHLDPFVLLDEFYVTPPAAFPDHPHRGFEALTYMLEGAFHHRDNMGNDSIVTAGGAQRFAAGRGIVHAELPGTPNLSHGLQLWVTLPRRLKGMEPDYQQVEPSAFPERKIKGGHIRTIVGEGSPVRPHTPMRYLDITLEPEAVFEDEIPREWHVLIYVLEGRLYLDEVKLASGEALVLEQGGQLKVVAKGRARFVLIAGKPHGEPIHQHGPFVD